MSVLPDNMDAFRSAAKRMVYYDFRTDTAVKPPGNFRVNSPFVRILYALSSGLSRMASAVIMRCRARPREVENRGTGKSAIQTGAAIGRGVRSVVVESGRGS